ncbi:MULTISPECIES: hypothetical protein [unclassified Campylobacter]|uniref:hypothetical protein n=1 Tax=unclassified Campylobacter TaxID=2593542 RepID=UPI0022EA0915|nr:MULTISPECIES: hypothetical protein [unclassified Campylobacter]MDA3043936.1 hypothetical protein [Campylobacter sp. JMF_09 ED2]MDA3045473.1 hypothetical protein [Campylobacter sp. JMF_07 ED4]MDA3064107.1 hypothetical protein [Campylobacter sp. JMF_11 EL3]MDA3072021.1 hypothetical protein [Campylobacter sp. VBCF_03 NA9]MDA3075714.1 hypothetical protein [Campylobacter sp. JMF_05 ED3]
MVVKKNHFIFFLLSLLFLTPNFYYYSYGIARLTDFTTILIMALYLIFNLNNIKINKQIYKYLVVSYLFFVSILISLLLASANQKITFKDFVDLIRPLTVIISILFGICISKQGFNKNKISNFIIFLGLIAGSVSILEKIGLDIFYKLYSDANHALYNRTSSIYYDFAEFGIMQLISVSICIERYINLKAKKYIFYILFILIGIIFSTSKASILLFFIFTSMVVLFNYKIIFFKFKNLIYFIVVICILAFGILLYINYGDIKLISGFQAIYNLDNSDASVGNRTQQIETILPLIFSFDLNTLFGYTSFREFEHSYIEVAFFSNLFRFGIIGTFLYYLSFLLIIFEKNLNFLIKSLVISACAIDLVAAMTNRFSFPILMFILIGILLTNRRNEI